MNRLNEGWEEGLKCLSSTIPYRRFRFRTLKITRLVNRSKACKACVLRYCITFDGEFLAPEVAEVLQQNVLPVAAIRDQAEIRQRFFGGANLFLHSGQ